MTKHLARQSLDKCTKQFNQHRADGRARAGLDVHGAGKSQANLAPNPSVGAEEAGASPQVGSGTSTEDGERPDANLAFNLGVDVGGADGTAAGPS